MSAIRLPDPRGLAFWAALALLLLASAASPAAQAWADFPVASVAVTDGQQQTPWTPGAGLTLCDGSLPFASCYSAAIQRRAEKGPSVVATYGRNWYPFGPYTYAGLNLGVELGAAIGYPERRAYLLPLAGPTVSVQAIGRWRIKAAYQPFARAVWVRAQYLIGE